MTVKEFLEGGEEIINAEKSLKNKKDYDEIEIMIAPKGVEATLTCKVWKCAVGFRIASTIRTKLSNFKYKDKQILDCDFASWKIEGEQLIIDIE